MHVCDTGDHEAYHKILYMHTCYLGQSCVHYMVASRSIHCRRRITSALNFTSYVEYVDVASRSLSPALQDFDTYAST